MSELKPCPFCGGEAQVARTAAGYWAAYCEEPMCGRVGNFKTEAEAIAAWNTRAETVTVVTGITTVTDTPQITYVPERTCYDRNASAREHGAYLFMWRCSNCDESYDTEMGKLNFCPNCGARVTPKNSETTPKVVSE